MLVQSHVEPLADLVAAIRHANGPAYDVPEFDPLDGGIAAEVLFLLEAPGPKATSSGFISRNKADETAKSFFLLNAAAGIERRRTITWNTVPWYIGSKVKIRPASRTDVREADEWLVRLLTLLQRLRCVVFVGKSTSAAGAAARARRVAWPSLAT